MAIAENAAGSRLGGSARWSGLWGLGMLLTFVGERIIGSGSSSRLVADAIGLLLIVVAMGARARRASAPVPAARIA